VSPSRRQPLAAFLARAGLALALVLAAGAWAMARFRVGIDDQAQRCLGPERVYLIDRAEREPRRGALLAFRARGMEPYVADGTVVIKLAAALPGDTVEVGREAVRVNGRRAAGPAGLTGRLGLAPGALERTLVVPPGHWFALGAGPLSYDSRYWGLVTDGQVIGRAHGLL